MVLVTIVFLERLVAEEKLGHTNLPFNCCSAKEERKEKRKMYVVVRVRRY
jgi:hypothetical protein